MATCSVATGCRLVAEPSGAVSTAAYLHHAGQLPDDGRFVAVVSGGNVATDAYAAMLARSAGSGEPVLPAGAADRGLRTAGGTSPAIPDR